MGRSNLLTIKQSVIRDKRGVTETGRKSEGSLGCCVFRTGVVYYSPLRELRQFTLDEREIYNVCNDCCKFQGTMFKRPMWSIIKFR